MDFSKINRRVVFILVFIFLFAFILRFFPLRIAHFWDETVYLQHTDIMLGGENNFNEFSFRPPLLSILFLLAFLVKNSPVSASILVALIGAIGAVFIYLIGKKVYNEQIGLVAAILFAFIPFLSLNSNYLLTDIPAIVLSFVAFYLVLFRENNYFLFFSGIFFGLSILMKFTSVLLGLIFLIWFLMNKFEFKKILIFSVGTLLVILPLFIWSQVNFGNFLYPFIVGQSMVTDVNESYWFYLINLHTAFTFLTLFGLASLIYFLFKDKVNSLAKKENLLFLIWIVVFLSYLTLTPHKELRYILPITLPTLLLASCGLFCLYNSFEENYRKIILVLFCFFILIMIYNSDAIQNLNRGVLVDSTVTDEMLVSDYLREINYTGIIYTNQRAPILAYYTKLKTELVLPYDERIYPLISEKMKNEGIFIGMHDSDDYTPFKKPNFDWLSNDSRFEYLDEIGNVYIFKYNPK